MPPLEDDFSRLIPPSEAGEVLRRMPPNERLPDWNEVINPLQVAGDIPEEIKEYIRNIGVPARPQA